MAMTLPNASRSAMCDALVDLVDGGAGAGTIEIKTGASTVAGTNEAATLTFSDPAFGAASNGVATANSITSDTSATGGTASHCTVFDSNSAAVWQGTVTATSGGGDVELSSTTIGAGATVSISSMTVTVPAS